MTASCLPGLCGGDLEIIAAKARVPVERGPGDLRDLPEFFGTRAGRRPVTVSYDIAILAEINHVPRLSLAELLDQARAYRAAGADVIDLGCDPGDDLGRRRRRRPRPSCAKDCACPSTVSTPLKWRRPLPPGPSWS